MFCLAEEGAFAEALTRGEEAVQLAEADGHPFSLTSACLAIGSVYLLKGDFHKAMLFLDRGLELSRVWSIPHHGVELASALSYALALSGRVPEALALLVQTFEQAPFPQWIGRSSVALSRVGEVYLLAGRLEDATAQAVRALELSRDRKERGVQAWSLRLLGEITAQREPPEAAQAQGHYWQALALADELGMRPLQAHCHLGLGVLYGKIGQLERARAELSAASELYRVMEMTFWLRPVETAATRCQRA
jgi:tetratricopeptide (TPR) repeat protein